MKKLTVCLIIAVTFFIMSCDKEQQPLAPKSLKKASTIDWETFKYPLEIGNSWQYDRTFSITLIPVDTSKADSLIQAKAAAKVHIAGQTMIDSTNTFHFVETYHEKEFEMIHEGWYANQADGFYCYAYKNAGVATALFKDAAPKKLRVNGRMYHSVREISDYYFNRMASTHVSMSDSMIYENPPTKMLPYPMTDGTQWVYRRTPYFTTAHRIVGEEAVECPAGTFLCKKIEYLFYDDVFGRWVHVVQAADYISEAGLVKRILYCTGELWTTDDSPFPIGTVNTSDEMVLTQFTVK